jgi:hypothetical protein
MIIQYQLVQTQVNSYINIINNIILYFGYAVTWLRRYATVQKAAGPNPDEIIYLILPATLWPWG